MSARRHNEDKEEEEEEEEEEVEVDAATRCSRERNLRSK